MVENPKTQYCYLNSNNSDKLFNTFVSKRTDDKDSINFVIAKHVGETASGQVYKLKRNQNEPSSTNKKEHQLQINKVEELVQHVTLDYKLNQHAPPQASCWLTETVRDATVKEKKGRAKLEKSLNLS